MPDSEVVKSTHKVEIVPVTLLPHGNADSLSVVEVFGYTYVARTEDWQGVTKAAYIPPDSLVDVRRPEFAFLADQAKGDGLYRVKAKKLRGIVSFGLMVPVPDDTPLGDDWAERLGVTHYEPPLAGQGGGGAKHSFMGGGEVAQGPAVYTSKYDLDAFRRYHGVFEPGEPVYVSEKLDGANARYVFHDGQMYCGSRTEWKREFADYSHITPEFLREKEVPEERIEAIMDGLGKKKAKQNMWWEVMRRTPSIEAFCRAHPGWVLYGEVFGNVNCIKYGLPQDTFAAFDVLREGCWLDPEEMLGVLGRSGVPVVPVFNAATFSCVSGQAAITGIPYDFEAICAMAEGQTLVEGAKPGTIREGCVVKPMKERTERSCGRVALKCVSSAYLERYR